MNFSNLAKSRFSVRAFKDTPLAAEDFSAILEAARIAPSACNYQPVRIKVITAPDELKRVDLCTPCRYNAPTVLLVGYDSKKCWSSKMAVRNSGDVDSTIVIDHLIFAAWERGVGSCWVMWLDPQKVLENFKLPKNFVPVAFLPIGYAADGCTTSDRHEKRVPIEKMLI